MNNRRNNVNNRRTDAEYFSKVTISQRDTNDIDDRLVKAFGAEQYLKLLVVEQLKNVKSKYV